MLALTKKTDYGLIALAHLAKLPEAVASAREIADSHGIPLPLLTNILKCLSRQGIVVSERGANGGYRLARRAETINLLELITAMEGPLQFVRCAPNGRNTPEQSPCDLESTCPIRMPAHRIRARLKRMLESITLSELINDGEAEIVELQLRPC